ncbi:MAG TPA: glycosyltransferase family 39 protein [Acidobacteriaceae bacterium]|jgi:hypothetical protein|nr:glycosyltransferase family 39 protein [Acidobacteriaceae bacterium]
MSSYPVHPSASSRPATPTRGNTRFAALLILLLTAAIALVWSHVKLLSQDEIFVLQTDSVSSIRELIHIQRSYPISLDPLLYHLLAHACTKILGPTALALRLPSLFGFLLMQLCIFFATRRIAGPRAALIATGFPALTATLFYAPEARPYGLLLGLYALTFLCWQTATRRVASPESSRTGPLLLLAISIALTINSHYFGILLLIPLCLAEFARTIQRRRLDFPLLLAILIGIAGVLATLPFQHAAAEFRKHYYNAGAITLHAISQAYRSLFVNYSTQPLSIQRLADIVLILLAIALVVLCAMHLHRKTADLPTPELVFLLALAALPLFGVLLAVFVTHSIEVRYVLSALIAVAIFVAIAVAPWLGNRTVWATFFMLLVVGIVFSGILRIRDQQRQTANQLASLILTPDLKAQLLALPDSRLYIQDMGHFEFTSYYEPDPNVRSRMTLLYSRDEELRYDRHDTASLTAEHMSHFTGFTITPYAQLRNQPGEHMLVLYHSGWDWTDQALTTDAQITPLGPTLGGNAVLVRFRH